MEPREVEGTIEVYACRFESSGDADAVLGISMPQVQACRGEICENAPAAAPGIAPHAVLRKAGVHPC